MEQERDAETTEEDGPTAEGRGSADEVAKELSEREEEIEDGDE